MKDKDDDGDGHRHLMRSAELEQRQVKNEGGPGRANIELHFSVGDSKGFKNPFETDCFWV